MNKIVRIGTVADGSMFARIEYKDGKLSISGVIGPMRNGDARGSAGQFIMGFKEYDARGHMTLADVTPAPGWNAELVRQFFDAWDAWHLNDMRPNCAHQTGAEWDASREITLLKYELSWDAQYALETQAKKDATAHGRPVILSDQVSLRHASKFSEAGRILHELRDRGLKAFAKVAVDPARMEQLERRIPAEIFAQIKKHTDTKIAGWLYPSEHPSGLLGKPCAVCGYKYGTAWKREDVPADVIAFLQSLPETDVQPAWV